MDSQEAKSQCETTSADSGRIPSNVLASVDVATIVLDTSLCIRTFTPLATQLLSVQPQDIGRPIDTIAGEINDAELVNDARRVLRGGIVPERKVQGRKGSSYLLRILPHQSAHQTDGVVITLVNIDALRAMERELRLMSKVVMDAADPIIIEDLHGTIIYVNDEAEASYGWTREELVGSHVELLMPDAELTRSRELRAQCRNGEPVRNWETTRRRKSGQLCTILLTLSFVSDDEGSPVGIASIAKDITAQKRAESLAREAVERRDQFLAMLSHELRNPLGAVLNATYVLDDNCTVRKSCKSPCQVIQRQTHQMSRLLDDLLDVTRVTQGKIEIRAQPIDVREMIETVLPTVLSAVRERNQQLQVDIDPHPMTVHGDTTRLQQIQANLLTNAIKYTPPGGKIWLRAYPEDGEVVLNVRDTGEGIPEDMLVSVFDLFVQARATLDRADGGMGVGLTLVKQLVELHGGTVSAHSEGPGKGTEFIVRLPAYGGKHVDAAPPADLPVEEYCGCILVVEDNPDSRDMLKSLLEIYGYQVHAAPDGHAGLELLEQHRFDLALVDIGLPGIDGYEVARTIRRDPKHQTIRLVALTGYGADSDRAAVKEAGFDDHLVKPLQRENLDKVLPRIHEP